jgi:hypothetical protein
MHALSGTRTKNRIGCRFFLSPAYEGLGHIDGPPRVKGACSLARLVSSHRALPRLSKHLQHDPFNEISCAAWPAQPQRGIQHLPVPLRPALFCHFLPFPLLSYSTQYPSVHMSSAVSCKLVPLLCPPPPLLRMVSWHGEH